MSVGVRVGVREGVITAGVVRKKVCVVASAGVGVNVGKEDERRKVVRSQRREREVRRQEAKKVGGI